ncbi:MBOAT family O-acyltransferase [Leptospira yasudae]|uniref:MBOAT family protein n=1 Tax=Leptospira yasudae TaxID=2202201 RepID=A0A6N4QN91_9LEPT|nr:MBOAT family O-acyltransferase [Leptospira yasudae]TGL79079.1 MBOAT family protein [Leptospira yasudae]TGL83173.1 MBOAT family protein [Leptospira yasudae]TGL87433.1 MBOAT family protein [Leptospira yasudae]
MIFNSAVFIYFFLVVLAVCYFFAARKTSVKLQNVFLLIASYTFYGWWDWIFLILIISVSVSNFYIALLIEQKESPKIRGWLLFLAVIIDMGMLGFFKYYNFFIENLGVAVKTSAGLFGVEDPTLFQDATFLQIILPVGISFFTFQTLSYVIDVYYRKLKADTNLIDFSLFVCFFPQLVAGPIERAGDLLPQIKEERKINLDLFYKGCLLLLVGYYMKTYVADNLAELVNLVFLDNPLIYKANPDLAGGHSAIHTILAFLAFFFQIYCDFAGYSYIARGSAFLLGFNLSENFITPEFSVNFRELFRRWHVTLNRWFTDYVYIPLGGSKVSRLYNFRNLFIIFGLSGIWHGASWNFAFWGLACGLYIVLYMIFKESFERLKLSAKSRFPFLNHAFFTKSFFFWSCFFTTVMFAMTSIFFRSYDGQHARILFSSILENFFTLRGPNDQISVANYFTEIIKVIGPLLIWDYFHFKNNSAFFIFEKPVVIRVLTYLFFFYCIVLKGVFGKNVIYFAF